MNVATIPPGGVAYAHIHVDFELMLYILEGRVRHEYGPGLDEGGRERGGRLHLHRAGRAARGVQPERHRAGRRGRRPLRRRRVAEHHPLRPQQRARRVVQHAPPIPLTTYGRCVPHGRSDRHTGPPAHRVDPRLLPRRPLSDDDDGRAGSLRVPEQAVVEVLRGDWPIVRLRDGIFRDLMGTAALGLMRMFVRSRAAVIESVGDLRRFFQVRPVLQRPDRNARHAHPARRDLPRSMPFSKVGHDSDFVTHSFQFFDPPGRRRLQGVPLGRFPQGPRGHDRAFDGQRPAIRGVGRAPHAVFAPGRSACEARPTVENLGSNELGDTRAVGPGVAGRRPRRIPPGAGSPSSSGPSPR